MSRLAATPLVWTPAAAGGISLTSGSSSWAPGAWVELFASTAAPIEIAYLRQDDAVFGAGGAVDVGVGAIGAEVVVGSFRFVEALSKLGQWAWPLPVPLAIASGVRVALRLRRAGTAVSAAFAIGYYANLDATHVTTYAPLAAPAGAGVPVIPNGVAWGNSAWAELTSGLDHAVSLYGLAVEHATGAECELDIGVGAAGAETVLTTLRMSYGGMSGDDGPNWQSLPAPYPIPATTRVAVRLRKSGTSTTNWAANLLYYDGVTPAPVLLAINPDHGPVAGGTAVTLTGANFLAGAGVTFGGTAATDVIVASESSITCVTPAHAAGFVDVVVTNPDTQTGTLAGGFRFLEEATYDPGEDVSGETIGYVWDELVDAVGGRHGHTDIGRALNDPGNYYGGRKAPVVTAWTEIERALSDYRGLYEGCSFGVEYTDGDWTFRTLHASHLLAQASLVIRTITETARATLDYARTLVRGLVAQALPLANRKFKLQCSDVLSRHFGLADDERQVPRRALSRTQFPDLPSDQVGKAEPIIYGAVSDEGSASQPPLITYDPDEGGYVEGATVNVGYGHRTSDADPPSGLTCTAVAGGALSVDVPNAEYGVFATSVDADGDESDPIPFFVNHASGDRGEFLVSTPHDTVSAGTQQIDVAWTLGAGAAKTRVYFGYYYYGFRVTQVLEVDAPTAACSFTAGPSWLGAGAITPGATPPVGDASRWFVITGNFADGESAISNEAKGATPGYRRPLRVRRTSVAGLLSWNVYARTAAVGPFDRKWTIDAAEDYFDEDLLDTGVTLTNGLPAPRGLVPTLHVGSEAVGGGIWQRFLVASHACKAVLGVYQADQRVDAGRFGVDFLAPGFTGWPFAAPYRDIGGRRYTLLYVRGPDADLAASGARPITLNVEGVEDVGDGSGDLIAALPLQELHFLQNVGFVDASTPEGWLAGAWLDSPTFATDPAPEDTDVVAQIDEASFRAARDVLEARLAGASVGGGIIGNRGEWLTLREVLARFHVSGGYDVGINRKTQYFATAFDDRPAAFDDALVLTEAREIDKDSFSIDEVDAEHWNARPFAYGYDWARGEWREQSEISDAPSIARYGLTRRAPLLELYFLRPQAIVEDRVARELARTVDPPRRVRLRTPGVGFSLELGDPVLVTHGDGVGAAGWTEQPCRVIRHIAQPATLGVELVLEDVGDRLSTET